LKFHFTSDKLRPFLGANTMTLTDQQELAVIHATRPLKAYEEKAFLAALATYFAGRQEVGDGELGRLLRALQREYFKPPSDIEIMLERQQAVDVGGSPIRWSSLINLRLRDV